MAKIGTKKELKQIYQPSTELKRQPLYPADKPR